MGAVQLVHVYSLNTCSQAKYLDPHAIVDGKRFDVTAWIDGCSCSTDVF